MMFIRAQADSGIWYISGPVILPNMIIDYAIT
jgi:hypothetical protein